MDRSLRNAGRVPEPLVNMSVDAIVDVEQVHPGRDLLGCVESWDTRVHVGKELESPDAFVALAFEGLFKRPGDP
jgi:hypothetical protein